MPESTILVLLILTVIASIPIIIWLFILFSKTEQSKKTILIVFGLGCLTAPALIGVQYLWEIFPEFNLAAKVEDWLGDDAFRFWTGTFILFGVMEEITKHYVISIIDKKTVLIKTINDTIRYSLAAGLGFAFTENVYYLYNNYSSLQFGDLLGLYVFRSVFTACAHMIFSGILGYFYAMGKFSIYLTGYKKNIGGMGSGTKFLARLFNLPVSEAYREKLILKGVFLAVVIHATYNMILTFNHLIPVVIFVILGAIYMWYLMKRKAGNLLIATDITSKKDSTLAKKDKEVILELLGMWFKEKRYVDVIHICERLLERDPDNKVVQYFKEKAQDEMEQDDVFKKVLSNVLKTKEEMSQKDRNVLTKHIEEKEMFNKVKQMIKRQMEKEGKEYIEYKLPGKEEKKNEEEEIPEVSKAHKKGIPKKYTGEGTFKI